MLRGNRKLAAIIAGLCSLLGLGVLALAGADKDVVLALSPAIVALAGGTAHVLSEDK